MIKLFATAVGLAAAIFAGAASAQTILAPAQQGVAYSAMLSPPTTFTATTYTSADLPAGLSLVGPAISGTPTTAGAYTFTVGVTGSVMSTCMIPGGPPAFTPTPMPCPQPASTVQTYQLQVSPSAVAAVPTMTEWAMILLGVMLAGGAALTLHRRRTA